MIPLSGLFDLARAQEIDFLKVDIEGSEHDVFAAASPDLLRRFKRIAMEYHDQIVPGTLALLHRVLTPTHEITVRPSKMEGLRNPAGSSLGPQEITSMPATEKERGTSPTRSAVRVLTVLPDFPFPGHDRSAPPDGKQPGTRPAARLF